MKNNTIVILGVLGLGAATLGVTAAAAISDKKAIKEQLAQERALAQEEIKKSGSISKETQARILSLEASLSKNSAKNIRKR